MSKLLVLDFDIENRPLSYLGEDFTTRDVTAIAWCWDGEPKSMECRLLGRDDMVEALCDFWCFYNEAHLVTGHYIRKHDLPVINGALVEYGLEPLPPKRTCDTKLDLVQHGSVISGSQENLCETLGVRAPKIHMNTPRWREANRLTPEGIKLTEKRVVGDVRQHMAMRRELVKRGLLGPSKFWRPA